MIICNVKDFFIAAAQPSESQQPQKIPKRSLSVRHPRKQPYQKHKREASEPFVPPPPPGSHSGKYNQPLFSIEDSIVGGAFSPNQGKKFNRSLTGSRENLLTKSFRAMAQLRPKVTS